MTRSEFNQKDSDIEGRNDVGRAVIAIATPIFTLLMGYWVGSALASFFKLPSLLGMSIGLGLGALGVILLIPRLYVVNDAVSAFVTVNLLTNELVSYGPGFHFCYPWEGRSGANNVDLSEAAEPFIFTVQTQTGTLNGEGSFRLRPDIKRLPEFLAGVASVASDLGDLLSANAVSFYANPSITVRDALSKVDELNKKLARDFKHGSSQNDDASEFEERFGVIIGDVTISKLMPSKEVQKAMDGASESAALEEIIARSLGKKNMAEVHAAVANKDDPLTSEQVTAATKLAMAMTDNLHGMDFKDHNFNLKISGDPELAQAIGALAPAAAAFFARGQTKPKGK